MTEHRCPTCGHVKPDRTEYWKSYHERNREKRTAQMRARYMPRKKIKKEPVEAVTTEPQRWTNELAAEVLG